MAQSKAWTPVLDGGIFCSPACGGACTLAAHDIAQSRAKALAGRLGKGWEPKVWENLGWHFRAVDPSGTLKVHPSSGRQRWTAYLGGSDAGGRWVESGTTPEAAIRAVRKVAEKDRDLIETILVMTR